jgi:hypothetical protein
MDSINNATFTNTYQINQERKYFIIYAIFGVVY